MPPQSSMDASASRPQVVPVIMSGGSGTRLWPLSTEDMPKQFHALASERSMFDETLRRFADSEDVRFLPPITIANVRHRALVAEQLDAAAVKPSMIVLEPFGRNTAAVAAVAAQLVAELFPGALALLLPADHVVEDPAGFQAAVARGAEVARTHIVTFGVQPTRPETGYGYIQRGEALQDGVFRVARFAEKPSAELALAYFAGGDYTWNAGIFLFSPSVMVQELRRFRPEIAAAASAALEKSDRDGPFLILDPTSFAACPSESIDYAVMEHTDWSAVTPIDIGWADVGSWSELWRLGPQDEGGNLVRGEALTLETHGTLVWAGGGRRVATLGVSDLIIVAHRDAVIVLPKERAQDLKRIVSGLVETKDRSA